MRKNEYGQSLGPAMPEFAPRPAPARQIIEGRYCRLEPVSLSKHGQDLYQAHFSIDDDRFWTYLLSEKPKDRDECMAYVESLTNTTDPTHYAVVDQKTGKALGSLSLMRIDQHNGVVEIGHVNFSPLLQKTTQATEALYLLLNYVFKDLGYRRCEWKCDNFNQPSKIAATRFGFSFEGVFRQAIITKGRSRDTAWFAIIDQDWPELAQNYERWLAPSNFDAAGAQKSKLNHKA